MKKLILLLLFITTNIFAEIYITPDPPKVDLVSYIIIDHKSSKELAGREIHKKHPPASLTKLMTAYVVFNKLKENIVSLKDKVRISEKAWKTGGSKSFIEVGKKIELETLIKGIIIQSGNDSSVAIAEHVAGSESTFVDLMNRYADFLGMKNTQFENASGLPHPNQYSSAYDLAILSQKIIEEFPEYYDWFKVKEFTYNNIKQMNRNRLLWMDNTVDGLKTGHTDESGFCLVSSAKRVDDMRLIVVALGAKSYKSRFIESQKLLDYGFRFFETKEVTNKDEVLTQIKLFKGKKNSLDVGLQKVYHLTVPRGQFKNIKYILEINNKITAPIAKNQKIGKLKLILDENIIKTYPLVSLEDVESAGFLGKIIDSIKMLF